MNRNVRYFLLWIKQMNNLYLIVNQKKFKEMIILYEYCMDDTYIVWEIHLREINLYGN